MHTRSVAALDLLHLRRTLSPMREQEHDGQVVPFRGRSMVQEMRDRRRYGAGWQRVARMRVEGRDVDARLGKRSVQSSRHPSGWSPPDHVA